MEDRIIRAMVNTWDAIGADCLIDDMGNRDPKAELPKDHVIEIVLDASHMEMYGRDGEAVEELRKMPYEKMIEIGKKAFTYETYGW